MLEILVSILVAIMLLFFLGLLVLILFIVLAVKNGIAWVKGLLRRGPFALVGGLYRVYKGVRSGISSVRGIAENVGLLKKKIKDEDIVGADGRLFKGGLFGGRSILEIILDAQFSPEPCRRREVRGRRKNVASSLDTSLLTVQRRKGWVQR